MSPVSAMKNKRAILREPVLYDDGGPAPAAAPRGEYAIDGGRHEVGLSEQDGKRHFTLSLDAFQQYVVEGRISLIA